MDSQSYYSSSSEADRMVIDLERSEGSETDRMIIDLEGSERDTGAASTDNETDASGQFLLPKQGTLPSTRSEESGQLLPPDRGLTSDVFQRLETPENDYHISSGRRKCDGADVNTDEDNDDGDDDNPFDVRESDSDIRVTDSESDNRLVASTEVETDNTAEEEEYENEQEKEAPSEIDIPKAREEEAADAGNKASSQSGTISTSQDDTCLQRETHSTGEADKEESISQRGSPNVERGEAHVDISDGKGTVPLTDPLTAPATSEHSGREEANTEGNKVSDNFDHTFSPPHSVPYDLSETFLDNLNPQDDSQDLDEAQVEGKDDIDEEGQREKRGAEDRDGDENDKDVHVDMLTGGQDQSYQYELSETFLDNLNPQDSSQDVDEANCESDGEQAGLKVVETSISEASLRTQEDAARDGACVPRDNCDEDNSSAEADTCMEEEEPLSPRDKQQLTDTSHVTSLCEEALSSSQQDRCALEAEASSPHKQQSIDTELAFHSDDKAHETLSIVCQERTFTADSSSPVRPHTVDEATCPSQGSSCEDVSQECIQSQGEEAEEDRDASENEARPAYAQKDVGNIRDGSEDERLEDDSGVRDVSGDENQKDDSDIKTQLTYKQKEDNSDICGVEEDDKTVDRDSQSDKEKDVQENICSSPARFKTTETADTDEEPSQIECSAVDSQREEGEYSSSPSPQPSEPADSRDGKLSDGQLSADDDDGEIRDEDSKTKDSNTERREERKRSSHWEKPTRRKIRAHKAQSSGRGDSKRSSGENASRGSGGDKVSAAPSDLNTDVEDTSTQKSGRVDKTGKKSGISEEDGIDIIDASLELDNNVVAADTASSAQGPSATPKESGDKGDNEGGDIKAGEESDDDVQIIEVPAKPVDTLIVTDDDDDNDDVPTNTVTSKPPPVSEPPSSKTSKKKRTVEKDGNDLRIVISDEHNDKEDSDRHRQRRDRERRDERRSDSRRRSESDRKSSDRSYRRHHHRSRSHSRERRRKRSRSRSHSRDRERSSRRRHYRERSRDKSPERERERERSSHRKRRRDRSRERERHHQSHSRSRSPKHSREDSWDKENRDDWEGAELKSKRRRHYSDEKKRRKSQESERRSSKRESPARHKSSSQKQSSSWKPSDTLRDPSESPSTVRDKSDDEDSQGSAEEEPVPQKKKEHVCKEKKEQSVSKEKKEQYIVKEKKEQSVVCKEKKEHVHKEKKEHYVVGEEKKEVPAPAVATSMPEVQDIPIPIAEDIPMPQPPAIPPLPEPVHMPPVPQPQLILPEPVPPPPPLPPPPFFENPPLPPVPEEEPMENPVEPPPLPPRWPEVAPQKGEGLLPTPIRRKAALEEAAAAVAVYDPAHPTDDEGERFMFPGVPPNAGLPPPPEMMGGAPPPPRLAGPMRSDGTFVVPAPGEGSLLGPPPPRMPPMQPMRFGPHHRPMMMNHVVLDHPPFSNGPVPHNQPQGLPPRFHMEMGGPGEVMPPQQNQFGQGPPPHGPPLHHQGFSRPLQDMFEDGPPPGPPPVGPFPVSVHSGMPEMPDMGHPPPGPPPPDMHMMPHPLPQDMPMGENHGRDQFNKTLTSLVVAQNLLSALAERRGDGEPAASLQPHEFQVPPPVSSPSSRFHPPGEGALDMDPTEDSTEVMDMDMSPLDEDFEESLGNKESADGDQDKKAKPLVAIDLKAISNALKKFTSVVTDDMPASAVELTNKEKYMKKLHLQERVVDEVKQALRPYYSHKKIDKEEYKTILRKAVPKVCHSKTGDINPQKIQQLVEGYVVKFQKHRHHTEPKTEAIVKPAPKTATVTVPKEKGIANGERAKPAR